MNPPRPSRTDDEEISPSAFLCENGPGRTLERDTGDVDPGCKFLRSHHRLVDVVLHALVRLAPAQKLVARAEGGNDLKSDASPLGLNGRPLQGGHRMP